jgi:diguanylate cyclase (GGDEF)-like protein/PAS domain S-box-containing protein
MDKERVAPHIVDPRGPEAGAGTTRARGDVRVDVSPELEGLLTEFVLLVSPNAELVAIAGRNTLGYEPEERFGHHIAEHIHPDDLPRVYDLIERARRTAGFRERIRVRARHRDGSWRVFDAQVFDAALRSALRGAIVQARDITDEVQGLVPPLGVPEAGSEPSDTAERFSSLAEMMPLGILSADVRGWVAYANRAARRLFAPWVEDLAGTGWRDAVVEGDRPALADTLAASATLPGTRVITFGLGGVEPARWVRATFSSMVSGSGEITGWLATLEDVTERHTEETRLVHQASHDPLTGLPNRVLLEDRIRRACGRLRRDASSVTVLYIDLDGFKAVNDRYGHHTGDAVLRDIADRLRNAVREVDTVARHGGDEFIAVCESLPVGEADRIRARIADVLRDPVVTEGVSVTLGASVGVAVTRDPDTDVAQLIEEAAAAMYLVKAKHRPIG